MVVATGKHADLMETSAIYADIYRSQLVEDADEVVEDGMDDRSGDSTASTVDAGGAL